MANKKKHYAILFKGSKIGESWAVSAKKAITNYWWNNDKCKSVYTKTDYNPSDYDAVEI